MAREVPHRSRVTYVSKSATGFNAVLDCGHGRILVRVDEAVRTRMAAAGDSWAGLLPEGYRPGDETECAHCPPDVIDDYAMFRDVRERLGTER